MKLIIDIGNTRAKLTAWHEGAPTEVVTTSNQTLDGLHAFAAAHPFTQAIVSTVVSLTPQAEEALAALTMPLMRLTADTPLPGQLQLPPTMGADRIAAIVGALATAQSGAILIIDAGTCVTYEVVDPSGQYLGGNIAPGLQMRLTSMHEHTSLLPHVEAQGDLPPEGYDTITAMRCGALRGLQHEIEGYIHHYRRRWPQLRVWLTGGDSFPFAPDIAPIIHQDQHLVARGLQHILDYNTSRQQ